MQFDMSGGSNDFGGNDSPGEHRMDLDDDYQPPRSSFEEICAKEEAGGGTRKIKPLPRRAQAAGVNSAAAQPKTAQETPEAIYLDIDTLRGDAG